MSGSGTEQGGVAGDGTGSVQKRPEPHEPLRQVNAHLLGQIEAATQSIARLEAGMQAGHSTSETDMALLQASVGALERRLEDARVLRLGREAALGTQILVDAAALEAAGAEQARLRARIAELEAEGARAAETQAALQRELAEAREAMDAARGELEKVFGSKSWKMTALLRATRRRLGE